MAPKTVFTVLPFLRNLQMAQKARVLHYIWVNIRARTKHSSLLDPFVRYQEN